MPKLEKGNSSNPYCVPAALAFLLDTTVEEAEKLLKAELGDQPITGIFGFHLKILRQAGFQLNEIRHFPKKTIPPGKFLVHYVGHAGVLIDGRYYDNKFQAGLDYIPRLKEVTNMWELVR